MSSSSVAVRISKRNAGGADFRGVLNLARFKNGRPLPTGEGPGAGLLARG